MTPDEKAASLAIDLTDYQPVPNLAPAARIGNTIYTSGHVSLGYIGKLGQDITVEQGKLAARVCAVQLLQAAYTLTGTLNTLRCVKVLGAVNCTPDFTEPHLVINGASELLWEIFGKEGRGYHARSALGFASLPVGVAVEIEAIRTTPTAQAVNQLGHSLRERITQDNTRFTLNAGEWERQYVSWCDMLELEDRRLLRELKLAIREGVQVFEELQQDTIRAGGQRLLTPLRRIPVLLQNFYQQMTALTTFPTRR